jgi:hypothetical protein
VRAGGVPFLDLEGWVVQALLVRMKGRVVLLQTGPRADLVEVVSLAEVVAEVGIAGDWVGLGDIVGGGGAVADMLERIAVAAEARFGVLKGRESDDVDIVDTVAAGGVVKEQAESTCFPAARSSRSSVI